MNRHGKHKLKMTAQSSETGQPSATPEGFIGKPEIARRLNMTVRTVDNWMARGILPYYKLGRTVAFRWGDVEAHLQANFRVCRRRGAQAISSHVSANRGQ